MSRSCSHDPPTSTTSTAKFLMGRGGASNIVSDDGHTAEFIDEEECRKRAHATERLYDLVPFLLPDFDTNVVCSFVYPGTRQGEEVWRTSHPNPSQQSMLLNAIMTGRRPLQVHRVL